MIVSEPKCRWLVTCSYGRLGAGVFVRVGGAVGEQAPSAARPDGRGAHDPG